MSKELKKVFEITESLFSSENPYVKTKDRIEWENSVFYVVAKFVRDKYYVLSSLGDNEIFFHSRDCS